MATIEELAAKVAELEQQMAAITAPPTEYYTSAYSGEEIDAAVKKVSEGLAGGVTSFNSRTGAVMPQSGDYNATQIPVSGEPEAGSVAAALSDKAPGGYGLGTIAPKLAGTADGILENCFFAAKNNTPFADWAYGLCISRLEEAKLQIMWSEQGSAYTFLDGCYAIRIMKSGVWMPWEYVNPPMQLSTEYRTAERYNGNPVYTKAVSLGTVSGGGRKSVEHGVTDLEACIECNGFAGYQNLVGNKYVNSITVGASVIELVTDSNFPSQAVVAIMKYTKTTD